MKLKQNLLLASILLAATITAQPVDLFKDAKEDSAKEAKSNIDYTIATFKSTRLVHGQSVETLGKGILDFRVHHRFGVMSNGVYDFFGLDNATTFIGLDYGISDRFMIGISRSTYLKQMGGFVKYKMLRQSNGKINMPVTVTLQASAFNRTADLNAADGSKLTSSDKTSYVFQALIARKLNENTSVQIMPTLVHYNLVPLAADVNDLFSVGLGFRQKISKRVSINAEYYYRVNKLINTNYTNSFVVGVDIETGGHVFQMHFTNSTGMTESTFINETNYDWAKGQIHFGFNISRVFVIKKPKEFKN
jgi:Membrane bound beta barrel domain (DUF5777)